MTAESRSAFTIQPGRAEDVAEIDRLLRVLAKHVGALDTHRSTPESLLKDGFGPTPMFSVLMAWPDGTESANEHHALGACVYLPDYSTWRGRAGVYILDLVVTSDERGSGIGLELMKAAARAGQDRWDAGYLILSVANSNEGARRFYRRHGFTVDRTSEAMTLENLTWSFAG